MIIECKYCDGSGSIDEIINCTQSASMCCGGCSKEIECPECEGCGQIKNDDDEEE